MNNLTDVQLKIILSYYYFDFKKGNNKNNKFINKYNDYFNTDLNEQLLTYYCSLFKCIDSSYNATPAQIDDTRFINYWNYYIIEDRIDTLKAEYNHFKKYVCNISNNLSDTDVNIIIDENIQKLQFTYIDDFPKSKYDVKTSKYTSNIRDVNVTFNALKISGFKCEFDINHDTFVRKNSNIPYTEGHHLIPLKYQDYFDVNLDVEANVVSLCSNCHNLLHYGRDFEIILKKLFNEHRQTRLKKSGINITFNDLLNMYK